MKGNKIFSSFEALKEAMFQHVKKNGLVDLEISNEPRKLCLGWLDKKSKTRWLISISKFKMSCSDPDKSVFLNDPNSLCTFLESLANSNFPAVIK